MLLTHKFDLLSRGGAVKRFHGHPVHTCVLNSEHSWGVAMIVWLIADDPSVNLLAHCLFHDGAEILTGDIPSPTKRKYPAIRAAVEAIEGRFFKNIGLDPLTGEEKKTLKIADYLDMMHFCLEELRMGNQNMSPVFENCSEYISEYQPLPEKAKELLYHLESERRKL